VPALTAADLEGGQEGSLQARLARGLRARTIRIERGERIAQLVFARFERPAIEIVERLSLETGRGEGGFGSTGGS
jgi:dUTP pyrophosphatase